MSDHLVPATRLTYAGALAALEAALERATELGVPVNVSVCDGGGHQLAFARMDDAALLSMDIAVDKAYSVVAFAGLPTAAWFDLVKEEPALREGIVHRDRLVIFGGGVPLTVDGQLVGAVGVSGGSADQDVDIASAGASALG